MSKPLVVYYYEKDPQKTSYKQNIPNENPISPYTSELDIVTYPLYNDLNNNIGLLKINLTNTSNNVNNDYYNYDFTYFFYNTDVTVTTSFSSLTNVSNLIPDIPICSTITYCSGNIYYLNGFVELLPYNNDIQSRRITITFQNEEEALSTEKILCSDCDGVLVKGDITEGSKYYPGIVEYLYSIGQVKSEKYPTFKDYNDEYFRKIDRYDTSGFCLPYEIYNPSQDPYIEEYWETTIKNYFVKYTIDYLQSKINDGYKIWIVSASPTVFIEPIRKYLKVDKILAIAPENSPQVITYAMGKFKIVQQNTDTNLTNVVGYIGDSWNNDGIIMQRLRNLKTDADLQFLMHGQTSTNDNENLLRYNIKKIYPYTD
jgi:hypothetical protein